MAYDFATDPLTGDWLFSGNRDVQGVEGEQVVAQRIRHRLRIVRGSWALDPSDGALGSRLEQMLRLPRQRAILEARIMVEEALSPMDDVTVTDVQVVEQGTTTLKLTILYQIIQGDDFVPDTDRLNETLTIELPV